MTNIYADIIEEIIIEMKASLPKEEHLLVGHEYFVWLDFLKKIKPESKLFTPLISQTKEYTDIREIMLLAEKNHYPNLYIQPHFDEEAVLITYENGELQKATQDMSEVWAVPRHLPQFSGTITGILNPQKSFLAGDIEMAGGFLQKMELLKNAGFNIVEYASFPTDKIASVSSNKLETSLINFISQARESGLKVDGVIIPSDAPLFPGAVTQIIFKPPLT